MTRFRMSACVAPPASPGLSVSPRGGRFELPWPSVNYHPQCLGLRTPHAWPPPRTGHHCVPIILMKLLRAGFPSSPAL